MQIILLLAGIAVGFIIGWLLLKSRTSALEERSAQQLQLNQQLNSELKETRDKNVSLSSSVAELKAINQNLNSNLDTQKEELERVNEKLKTEFENLANNILERKSEKFTQQNKDNLDIILNPLKEKIKEFEEKVDRVYKADTEERISLRTEIKLLAEQNKQIGDEARHLALAMRGDKKKQGDWGENILQLILEKAGLQRDIHYRIQASFKDEDGGQKRPDIIINLPEEKNLIVDSKVSLNAYVDYCASDDDVTRKMHLSKLVTAVEFHIKDLNSKNYHKLYQINVPDFVLLFIPLEGAFSLILENDSTIFIRALEERNIVIVTPSTLLATLSTVSSIWKQENQKKNALEIARQSGDLYDKFHGLINDLIEVGKKMDSSKSAYEDAMNKLSTGHGNLVSRVERLKKLGASTQKQLPSTLIERSEEDN
jgi:DNA recombination protein RmuC